MIKSALEQDIVILKFRPYITDVLQPLDVASFGPPKRIWKASLKKRANKFGIKLTSAIWTKGMKKENAISGFEKTGKIFVT